MQLQMRSRAAVGARSTVTRRVAIPARRPTAGRRAVVVRAEADASEQLDKLVKDLGEKWDKVENKTGVLLYGAAAVAALWFSSTIVGAINRLPLLPQLMELVGLTYSTWFAWRYLLFKSNREELVKDVDELKKKIAGDL